MGLGITGELWDRRIWGIGGSGTHLSGISSCVRSLVSGDSRGWCVDTWVVSNVTPPHLVNKGSGCRQGCTCRTSASHSIFCFALISITRYTSLTNILIPYKEKIFSVLIEAMLCVYGYHLSAP